MIMVTSTMPQPGAEAFSSLKALSNGAGAREVEADFSA
jgi:hypothetical protein